MFKYLFLFKVGFIFFICIESFFFENVKFNFLSIFWLEIKFLLIFLIIVESFDKIFFIFFCLFSFNCFNLLFIFIIVIGFIKSVVLEDDWLCIILVICDLYLDFIGIINLLFFREIIVFCKYFW